MLSRRIISLVLFMAGMSGCAHQMKSDASAADSPSASQPAFQGPHLDEELKVLSSMAMMDVSHAPLEEEHRAHECDSFVKRTPNLLKTIAANSKHGDVEFNVMSFKYYAKECGFTLEHLGTSAVALETWKQKGFAVSGQRLLGRLLHPAVKDAVTAMYMKADTCEEGWELFERLRQEAGIFGTRIRINGHPINSDTKAHIIHSCDARAAQKCYWVAAGKHKDTESLDPREALACFEHYQKLSGKRVEDYFDEHHKPLTQGTFEGLKRRLSSHTP